MRPQNFEHELNSLIRRAKLKFPEPAKEDLLNVLNNFHDLQPDLVNFVFPDGITRHCLSLSGTIPIHYKGGKYNIPVALYLLDNHPYSGPYCYVKPTQNMRIRTLPTVDSTGLIYLPYLNEWQHPNYDTTGLLQVLTISFQEKCPVYSVESTASSATNRHSSNHSPLPYPTSTPAMPYPTASSTTNTPYPTSNPPPPPYPTADPPTHLMPQPNVVGSGFTYNPSPPYPSLDHSTPGPTLISTQQNPSPVALQGYSTSTIQPTHIRASLLSAVEDRIKAKLRDKIGTPFAELQSIDANLKELHGGKQTLREMLENIARDQHELERVLALYTSKKEELQRALEAANTHGMANGTLNIEAAIDAQTPVHRQILQSYVQDCATDDTIYFLGQALKRGTINLQIYLKYVRQLSHQQFQLRLLMQKGREKARLPI